MSRVAIVIDSVSDMPPEVAARQGIIIVPLEVSFGDQKFRAITELTTEQFWQRMLTPGAPLPTTAAASPGEFKVVFETAFEQGAEAIICIDVSGELSGTVKSARIAAAMLEGREIHVIDSRTASMGFGMLAQMAAELAEQGMPAAEIAQIVETRKADVDLYVALDTLEYLKRGGRISGASAAVGSMLSIKPIITVIDGVVEKADQVRTRTKARERTLQLLTAHPLERATVLHSTDAEVEEFRDQFQARSGLADSQIQVMTIGPSVGPHVGPGCVGATILRRR
ncbi:MAG TPA: DegV family protein [Candidatus Limnocylindrales bacterium]